MSPDWRALAITALVLTVPMWVCLLVGLLRGYSIHLSMTRDNRDRKE